MNFANPQMLWLLLVIPPGLVAFFWWAGKKRERLRAQFIQARLLPALTLGLSAGRQRFRFACIVAASALAIIALARPQWGFDYEEAKLRGLDIVVAIDTSKSMLAEDIAPNRLARAKLAALDLMHFAKTDRLGLVAFAGSAFLQCPLTIDDSAFRQSVDLLDVNTIPLGGTALSEAIQTAMSAFDEKDNYKVLVLLTDGEDHDPDALEAARQAAKQGLRIYTIGIGSAEGEIIRLKNDQGGSDFVRDEQGNVVKSRLNEELLREIALETKGFYLPLRGAKTIDTLFEHAQGLNSLPRSEHQEKLIRRYHERFHWPLGAAILLLIIEMLFPERKTESNRSKRQASVPATPPAAKRPAAAMMATVLLGVLLSAPLSGRASVYSALRNYRDGKYEQAQKEYEELLQKKGDDPRLHFNAGAAAYQNKDYSEAAKQFNEVLNSPDLKLQELAYYNRGNTMYHMGEQTMDPEKRSEAWNKSIEDFESSLKLNPQDTDAKFNQQFVKQQLEKLKQQQQQQSGGKNDKQNKDQQKQDKNQQQNQQQNQQSKQDQKQNSQQQQQSQQQNSQQQQAQQQQSQQQQQQAQQQQQQQSQQGQQQKQQQAQQSKEDQKQQQAQRAEEEKKQQEQAAQEKKEKEKEKQQAQQAQQAQAGAEKKDQENGESADAAEKAGEMSVAQAKQLLDSQKEDESILQQKPQKPVDLSKPIKDW